MRDHQEKPDIVILTALPVEYQAVRAHLTNLEEIIVENLECERGTFDGEDLSWDVFLIETGQGNSAAGVFAERAVHYFKPNYIFFVGVAGGLKDAQMGDVVVAEYVYPYSSGKAGIDFQARPRAHISTPRLIARAKSEAKKRSWQKRILTAHPDIQPQVFVASIASGDQVIVSTSSETYKLLEIHFEDAKAVEMEGYGFLHAMKDHTTIGAIVIRGISDRLDNKREADKQLYQSAAADHASAFAFTLIANLDDTSPTIAREAFTTGDTRERMEPAGIETADQFPENTRSFFDQIQEYHQKIDEAFAFIEREEIYSDECGEAIKILGTLHDTIQSIKDAFTSYPGVHFGLNNLYASTISLREKLQKLRRLCISHNRNTALEQKQYKTLCDTIRQEQTDLLYQLRDLQTRWAQKNAT